MTTKIEINFERDEVYECGATLLAVLAYPKVNEEHSRLAEVHSSLCGRALWMRFLNDPSNIARITVAPQYVFREQRLIDRHALFVNKRLSERIVAGRMAAAFLMAAEGRIPPLPRGVKRLSVNEMSEFVREDAGQKDAGNVESRIWRPSRPVIYLAAAISVVLQEGDRRGLKVIFEDLLWNRELIETIVRKANIFAQVIAAEPKFPVDSETLIQFQLV